MIKCLYCGYECPDTANLCPNCGKPIIRSVTDKQLAFADTTEVIRRETKKTEEKETCSQKQVIMIASGVLLLLFIVYQVFAG